jgi:hypothetical protein
MEITPPSDVSSLSQILKHVEASCLPPDSVVRQIQIDGLPFIPDGSDTNHTEIFNQMEMREKVEIFTGTITEVANDSIAEALEYLDRIESATPSLAESFRVSPGPEAFENLRQLCEGFYWLNLLLDKLGTTFQANLKDCYIRDLSAPEYYQKFISVLKQLVESQENRDFILISDLLEYEILPLVPVWREILRFISQKVSMKH